MYSPIPHNLTDYDDQFDFEKNGVCPYQWEISVPQKNCIIWGVVLSYLRSADFSKPGQFEERLNQLTGNEFDPETVKSAILDFNPFFNIHKCFFDETLQKVKESFRKILSENRPRSAPKTVCSDMQLISNLLKINILIVDLESNKKQQLVESNKSLHLVTPSDGCSTDLAVITLFCRKLLSKDGKNPGSMTRFKVSLDKELCWEFRIKAFQTILESSEIRGLVETEIQQLDEKKEKKVNILIAFLKKNLNHLISQLYDSSYIVAKLADAGFQTDPRILDEEGFSAFYYAMRSNDKMLVYILYRYAANNCYETGNTFRDPDPSIISNFSKLNEILNTDCTTSKNFEEFKDRAEEALVTYQDLMKFNEFLTQVSRGINDIREKPESTSLEVAVKQKERILLILDTYDAFFSVGQCDSQEISEEELIENYTKHKTYYDNLDFTVALLFFDNIFLLKGVLKCPREGLFSELESSFVLSAIANKYFTGDARNGIKKHDLGLDSDSNDLFIIPLLERLNLREKVQTFCCTLRLKQKLVESDTVPCIPEEEIVGMLSDFPQLRGEFLISRLEHYMKSALETASDSLKQKFVIQRALQVMGESIKIDETDPSSIRHLLRKCLPAHTLEVLKKARNTLSHLLSYQFPLKFETEEDDGLFRSMKSEIRIVREAFEEIFDIQRVRLKGFLINRGLESVQKFQQNKSIHIHPLVQPMEKLGDDLRKNITELECRLDQKGTDENRVVPNIDEFCRRLMGFANESVRNKIMSEIPLAVSTRINANKNLFDDLERGIPLELNRFNNLFLKEKELLSIKNEYEKYLEEECEAGPGHTFKKSSLFHRIKSSPNPFNTLDLIFEKRKVSKSQINILYENITFSDKARSTLDSLIEMSKKKEVPCVAIESVKKEILDEIPVKVSIRVDANKKLIEDLGRGIVLDMDRFDSLFLKEEHLDNIKREYENYLKSEAERNGISKETEESEAERNGTSNGTEKRKQSPELPESRKSFLLQKIKKANLSNTLDLIFEKQKVSGSQLKGLVEAITFSDEARCTLNSLIKISKSPCGDNLKNLVNRVKNLYEISINEQDDIRFLWERAKSSKAKQHLVYKIVQRYFREPSFQASMEMLLFDCFGILKKNEGQKKKRKSKEKNNGDRKMKRSEDDWKKEINEDQKKKRNDKDQAKKKTEANADVQKKKALKEHDDQLKKRNDEENAEDQKKKAVKEHNDQTKKRTEEENAEDQKKKKRWEEGNYVDQSFFLKDSYLFNGIDVRNVLAHGDPLLESIGNILDPKDLPSELVKKMVPLLEDQECIEALCDLWKKAKEPIEWHKCLEALCDLWKKTKETSEWYKCLEVLCDLLQKAKQSDQNPDISSEWYKCIESLCDLWKKTKETSEWYKCLEVLCDLWQKIKQPDQNPDNSSEWYKCIESLCDVWQIQKETDQNPDNSSEWYRYIEALFDLWKKTKETSEWYKCLEVLCYLWQKAKQSDQNPDNSSEWYKCIESLWDLWQIEKETDQNPDNSSEWYKCIEALFDLWKKTKESSDWCKCFEVLCDLWHRAEQSDQNSDNLEDKECIKALSDLWQRAKHSDKSLVWNKLKERIVNCSRWQEYSKLLAEDPKDSEICESVVSFLKETTESQKPKSESKKKKGRNRNSESSTN